jgi:hypothetical protein
MDFPLGKCKMLIGTTPTSTTCRAGEGEAASQGPVYAHKLAVQPLESGDKLRAFTEIEARTSTWKCRRSKSTVR